ncbi:hypothetical protein M405DRAFT_50371 [Rhizopogon salebrosus TDB-379]|nr:hypothetical protein M405DRAFT_50371 [Rhizopogon salebrosus TDB-379]
MLSSLFFHFRNPKGQRALRSTPQQHATNPFSAHANTDHPEGPQSVDPALKSTVHPTTAAIFSVVVG